MDIATTIILIVNVVLWICTIMLMTHYARLGKMSQKQSVADTNPTLPSVAIVIVAQEECDKLRKHLPLFLEQKYPTDYQVIVVDIHSKDDTLALLEKMEEEYLHLSHSSVPSSARDISIQRLAMTLGLRTACTEWVIFTQADCFPEDDEWLANFMHAGSDDKNAIIGLTKYAESNNWLIRKRQFFRLWQQMLWMPFAEKHYPYRAEDTLLAYRKDYFISHNGFASDSKLLVGAATLLVNKNISRKQCAVSVNNKALLLQDSPLPHTWERERVFFMETRRHTIRRCLYRTWYAIKMLVPRLFTLTTLLSCLLWYDNYIVIGILAALWLVPYIVRDVTFNRTTKQLGIKSYHFTLPYLCFMVPLWDLLSWIRWRFTDKKTFRKKFV